MDECSRQEVDEALDELVEALKMRRSQDEQIQYLGIDASEESMRVILNAGKKVVRWVGMDASFARVREVLKYLKDHDLQPSRESVQAYFDQMEE